jgi:protein-S-isoprenylcysteine O-methyltransferase Ste14
MTLVEWHLYDRWDLVVLSIVVQGVILGLFLTTSVLPRGKVVNPPNGMLAAFIVALYVEMYGAPLTFYLVQPLLPGRLDLISYPPPLPMRFAGSVVILLGFFLVFLGWRVIFRSRGTLVEHGIYAVARHPQYVGLALVTGGLLLQWPTLTGLVLWPLLLLLYRKLSRLEDADLVAAFGARAEAYQQRVPAFLPRFGRGARQPARGRAGRVRRQSTGP